MSSILIFIFIFILIILIIIGAYYYLYKKSQTIEIIEFKGEEDKIFSKTIKNNNNTIYIAFGSLNSDGGTKKFTKKYDNGYSAVAFLEATDTGNKDRNIYVVYYPDTFKIADVNILAGLGLTINNNILLGMYPENLTGDQIKEYLKNMDEKFSSFKTHIIASKKSLTEEEKEAVKTNKNYKVYGDTFICNDKIIKYSTNSISILK